MTCRPRSTDTGKESINRQPKLSAALFGFFAGLMNGLIALGGGIFITPMLIVHRKTTPEVAVGTSLAAVVVLS